MSQSNASTHSNDPAPLGDLGDELSRSGVLDLVEFGFELFEEVLLLLPMKRFCRSIPAISTAIAS